MNAFTLMVQGTTSDAGKSTLVCGLCRALKRRGISVAPFKPQNMSLNSAVTSQGHEIGRAQALQAQASGLEPTSDMNPVLLKPNTDTGAQVIVHGRAIGNMEARTYHEYKGVAREAVLASYSRLTSAYEAVIVEGAGSPAEINLRAGDIANMGFAEAVDCPVILIADIERGGVFAHIVGTLELLAESERRRVIGCVINRFRGDLALLEPGLSWLEERTGKPVLGVLPYLHGLALDAEDGLTKADARDDAAALRVVVPVLPHISNHTDFDPLRTHPQVSLHLTRIDECPPPADLVILPGSKNVRADLEALRKHGWPEYLTRHVRYGGRVLGVCGGLQMLGSTIHDPTGIESNAGSSPGLALLDLKTELKSEKQLRNVTGRLAIGDAAVSGYEIHCGTSTGPALAKPFAHVDGCAEGARSDDDRIIGTYLHGVFESPAACAALLAWAGLEAPSKIDYAALREASIERLANVVEESIDIAALIERLRRAA